MKTIVQISRQKVKSISVAAPAYFAQFLMDTAVMALLVVTVITLLL